MHTETPFGSFDSTYGVPNEWGFLLFCACFTILAVIFHLTRSKFADRKPALMGYFQVAIEIVALLSWFAGFIAVAVNIGETCPVDSCGVLKAATVFGGFEWLLSICTAGGTVRRALDRRRAANMAKSGADTAM